ncbi:Protein CBG25729 [Caenorhabditis briggsae]|uniref:Protein CBG25729 n=1 Tax=Caenorhabditis briggsae TaxID=6238 RepID=B6IHQ0_CAEBR|nr:Protein CBG25729 [Caenorhabditis briggsae]CAR99430.1 Protein CBG25729 [Caenorhabditis briggsae]
MRKKEKIKRRRKRIFERKFLPLIKEREEKDGQRKEPNSNTLNHCQSVIEILENPFPSKETEKEHDLETIMEDVEPKNQRKMSNEEDREVEKIMEEMSLMESDESDEKLYNSSSDNLTYDNLLFSY